MPARYNRYNCDSKKRRIISCKMSTTEDIWIYKELPLFQKCHLSGDV